MALTMNPMADGTPLPFDQGLGLIGLSIAKSGKAGRVFWSGSREAMIQAMKFAKGSGRVTIEMTKAGKRLGAAKLSTRQGWIYASKRFAQGAKGIVHVFEAAIVRADSIWKMYEEPILRVSPKVTKIIKHFIGE